MDLDFTDPIRWLALLCGLAFLPHSIAKFTARPAVEGFFNSAGMRPASMFVYVSLIVEIVAMGGMIFGVFIPFTAVLAATFMLVAALAVWRVSGGRWVWNLGGCEFHVFWALSCLIVAAYYWPKS